MKKSLLATAALASTGLAAVLGAAPALAAPSASPTAGAASVAFTNDAGTTYRTLAGTPNQLRLLTARAAPSADAFGSVVDLPAAGTTGLVALTNGQCLRALFGTTVTAATCSSTDPFQQFTVVDSPTGTGVRVQQGGKVVSAPAVNTKTSLTLELPGAAGALQNVVPNR